MKREVQIFVLKVKVKGRTFVIGKIIRFRRLIVKNLTYDFYVELASQWNSPISEIIYINNKSVSIEFTM